MFLRTCGIFKDIVQVSEFTFIYSTHVFYFNSVRLSITLLGCWLGTYVGLGTNHIWGSHRDLAQKIRGGSSINLTCCNEPKSQPNSSRLLLTKTQIGYHNLMINHEKVKKCLNLTRIFLTHSKPTKNAIYIINIRRINLFLRNVYT